MNNIRLFIDHLGSGYAPGDWWLKNHDEMQRLYYIKGGTGYFWLDKSTRVQFEKGKIYVFPHNMHVNFETTTEDPINHIYFDFISYPPIISTAPVVYDVEPDSSVMRTLDLLESLFRQYDMPRMTERKIPRIAEAPAGSFDEKRQILYNSLLLLLNLLSEERELPFSNDAVINDVLAYIRKHYMEPITVSELAEHCGFVVNYFIRRFKSVMGQTPYSYLRSYRLLCARELLATGYTLLQTAEMVGYDNASSLSRALRLREEGQR